MTEDIDELLESMNRFRNKLQIQLYNQNKETQTVNNSLESSIFLHIPTNIIIKIFLYLNFTEDYPNILETCTFFHKIIISRQLQVESYKLEIEKTKKSESNSGINEEETKSDYNFESFKSKNDVMAEVKKFAAVNEFLGKKISNQDKIIEDLSKQMIKSQTDLRIQSNIKNKYIEKISKIERDYNDLREEKDKFQREIDNILNIDRAELEKLKIYQKALIEENQLIEKDNKILGNEISKLNNFKNDSCLRYESYSESIMKMKDYFQTMFEPRIKNLLESFK